MTAEQSPASGTASSLDGRTFSFRVSRQAPLIPGDLVLLRVEGGGELLGQVLDLAPPVAGTPDGPLSGSGAVIGAVGPDAVPHRAGRRPFSEASIEPASVPLLQGLQRSAGAYLPIGTWLSAGIEAPARLRAQGFNRHTFLCGQSGSGKTYALGVILEQLLVGTELRMVVLDPNADFVRLGEIRPDAPVERRERLGQTEVRVLRSSAAGGEPLRMRFASMPRPAQAAVLQLDPLADRSEYNLFLHMMEDLSARNLGELVRSLGEGGPDSRALAQRIENLGISAWEIWAFDQASAAEVVESGARATVMDLGGFVDPLEPLAASLDLLEHLWAHRERRTPTLIVIDEAHNLCPAEPSGPLQAAVTERLVQIAAEGRKFGLWLLLSTQRPSKLHPQVISQCDNLALMRMNSRGDLAELTQVFGFAPPAMLAASRTFAQGEVLVAGGFVPVPGFIRMGSRLTFEGGSDVSVPVR